ncbi:uncharacterized protein [Haliotis cracherodii]|uniref:uncharacterized protein n=1 Tax=Haliotis cracherodii TaxID=6455 RepID=UPI0039ED973F
MEGKLLVLLTLALSVVNLNGSFLEVNYPNVNVTAEPNGSVVIQGGDGGDILLYPGKNGTLYINGYDIEDIIAMVNSLPPVWTKQTVHDSLGTFDAGKNLSVAIYAKDPEGGALQYALISGRFPPGISLNNKTGVISGIAPNYDATYSFSIRVTDKDGKYADGTFSIDIRERELCSSKPCMHGGSCVDVPGGFRCDCLPLYGGRTCNVLCSVNPLGVGVKNKVVPDAQITAHYSFNGSKASDGRLDAPVGVGWVGQGLGSWLQVDLNTEMKLNRMAVEGVSTNYLISQFTVQYSTDGNTFTDVLDAVTKKTEIFRGSASYMIPQLKSFKPPFLARFVRFVPLSWHTGVGTHPGMRVELYGC